MKPPGKRENSSLFQTAIEATAEAIYNSLSMTETMIGYGGVKVVALPFSFVENRKSKHNQENNEHKE